MVMAAMARAPSSGLVRAVVSWSQVGRAVWDWVGPDAEQDQWDPGNKCGDAGGGGASGEAGTGGGHCSTPPTDRVMREWAWPVTVIEVMPMMPRNLVA